MPHFKNMCFWTCEHCSDINMWYTCAIMMQGTSVFNQCYIDEDPLYSQNNTIQWCFSEREFLIWLICLSLFSFLPPFPRSEGGAKRLWREASKKKIWRIAIKEMRSSNCFSSTHILTYPASCASSYFQALRFRSQKTETELQEKSLCKWHNDFYIFYSDVHDFLNV